MNNFIFQNPTKIIFGKNILNKVGEEVMKHGKNVMLVYGKNSIKENGVYDAVIASLKQVNITVIEFSGVKGNPILSHTRQGVIKAKENNIDVILAVGGGSVIDESKAIAAAAVSENDIWDFYLGKAVMKNALPIVCVLTLPATGSEMNSGSVLTNDETQEKFSMGGMYTYPKASFLDPEITYTLSLKQTAYACSDIMSHLMEAYFTTTSKFLPIQSGYAEGIIKGVMTSMLALMKDPNNYEARASLMWGATLGLNGIGAAGVPGAYFPSHALEHPISGVYDIAHGAGLSITTPAWLKFKKDEIKDRILMFGNNILGLDTLSTDVVIEKLEEFYKSIATPIRFADAGIDSPDIDLLAFHANKMFRAWGNTNYSLEDLKTIYKSAI